MANVSKPQNQPTPISPNTKPRPLQNHRNKLIGLAETDQELIKELSLQLSQRGYQVQVVSKLKELLKMAAQNTLVAIIIEVMLTEGDLTAPKVVLNIQKNRPKPLPVIFISTRIDMTARLVAARANGQAYFDKPLNLNALIEKLDQLTGQEEQLGYRILIIDDTGKYADNYAKVLQQVNMRAVILRDPMKILEALSKVQPSLILINWQLLGLNALELAVVIRQQQKSSHLPLIFFAPQTDQILRQAAHRGVADDVISDSESAEQLVATVTNAIKNAERYGQLQTLINRDLLTGLYNRRYLLEQLELAKQRDLQHPLTVIYIHLDSIQNAGRMVALAENDAVIIDTARLLREQVSKSDLLARLNDRVFVLLSFDRTLEEVKQLAQTIQTRLEQRLVKINDTHISTTCSIGIGLSQATSNAQQALRDADLACSQAREQWQAGHPIQLHQTILEEKHKSDRAQMIRFALNNNQFYLAYQPIVSIQGELHEYYDVLLRMHSVSSEEGIPPAELFFIAEKSELILQIDRWVIMQAVTAASEKHQKGQPVQFFVRLSGASLSDASLLPWLQKYLTGKQLPPATIIFDVSQSVLNQRLTDVQQFIRYVKTLGCRLALRDFEDNPTTLQLLSSLEVDFVKIKGSVVQSLSRDSEQLKMVQNIIKTVHRYHKQVIAPFVEDADSLSLLWQCDIDYIAGYFVQAPGNQLDYDFSDSYRI